MRRRTSCRSIRKPFSLDESTDITNFNFVISLEKQRFAFCFSNQIPSPITRVLSLHYRLCYLCACANYLLLQTHRPSCHYCKIVPVAFCLIAPALRIESRGVSVFVNSCLGESFCCPGHGHRPCSCSAQKAPSAADVSLFAEARIFCRHWFGEAPNLFRNRELNRLKWLKPQSNATDTTLAAGSRKSATAFRSLSSIFKAETEIPKRAWKSRFKWRRL